MQVTDEMVFAAYNRYLNACNETEECERCNGRGYHHGFGMQGHDPDWCENCGGPGIQPKYDEITAMRLALEAALTTG